MVQTRRRNKFRAKPTEYNGVRYDSKAEAARAQELDLLEQAGEVDWWTGQVPFRLGTAENVYRVDFMVCEGGEVHVEDVKGMETAKFKRDRKLWREYGPVPLHVLKRKRSGWVREVVGEDGGSDE